MYKRQLHTDPRRKCLQRYCPSLSVEFPASVCQAFIHVIKNCQKDDTSLWQFYFLEFVREELFDGGLGGGLLGALFAAAGSLSNGAAVEQDFHGKVLVMVWTGLGDQRVVKALVFFPLDELLKRRLLIKVPGASYRNITQNQPVDDPFRRLKAAVHVAVSYTHLDVYKRQVSVLQRRRNGRLKEIS